MDSLVSILIPAYNAEKWISDTIKSALGQTWTRKEIIVIDDGSTDQTLVVARRFASKHVQVSTQPNMGGGGTRNKLLSMAQGDYVQWLDADDLLSEDKIARQVRALEECGRRTLASSAWGYFMHRPNSAKFHPAPLWADLSPREWLLRKLEHNDFMQTATWLVSRELTELAGPWDSRLAIDQDGEYFCRVILKSEDIRFIPEAKVYYRRSGPQSVSFTNWSPRKLESRLISLKLHVAYLRSVDDSDRARKACLKFLERWLGYFYPEHPKYVQEIQQMAAGLGGELQIPRLPWKYIWIQKCFGWERAKRAQMFMPSIRESVAGWYDRAISSIEKAGGA